MGRDAERVRFSRQVRLHCKRVTADNWGVGLGGALMVGDNCLITHRLDSLQHSVPDITTAVHCLKSLIELNTDALPAC